MAISLPRRNFGMQLAVLGCTAIAIAACSSPATAGKTQSSRSPLRIAVVVGSSGTDALNGQQIDQGVQTAAAVLNSAGGVDGHRVDVTYDDDNSSPSTAVQDLRNLAGSGIHFVIGASTDPSCVAMQPVARQLGMTMVTPTCEDNKLTSPHPPTGYFQVAPTDTGLANGTADVAHRAYPNLTHWVVSNPDFSFGYIFWPQFRKKISAAVPGASFSAPQYIPLSATSFSSYVTQVASKSNPSYGLVSSTFGETLIGFVKAGLSVGLFKHFAGYLASAVIEPTLGALGSSVPNMWFSYTYYHSVFSNAANTTFIDKFRTLHSGTYPSAWNEMAYVAVQGIAAGVAKSHSTDAATVAKAMSGISINSPEGRITIDPATHIFHQYEVAVHVVPTSTGSTVVKSFTVPYSQFGR